MAIRLLHRARAQRSSRALVIGTRIGSAVRDLTSITQTSGVAEKFHISPRTLQLASDRNTTRSTSTLAFFIKFSFTTPIPCPVRNPEL
jgi:hypothetical protein